MALPETAREGMNSICKCLRRLTLVLCLTLPIISQAAHVNTRPLTSSRSRSISENAHARRRISRLRQRRRPSSGTSARLRRRHRYHERFFTSSYSTDTFSDDITEGEDATVRAAAIEALGNMNGTVVAMDPNTGRVLTMVNQKLALSAGAQPCSTIKVPVALAALSEGIVTKTPQFKSAATIR